MRDKSIDDFNTLFEAIDHYSKLVNICAKCDDYSIIPKMLDFEEQLRRRIEKETGAVQK
ncbi:hypothetical protein [Metabacillus indicus]|uniref:hypothetical protein n=1 Tax=Metabacillus indicus TaxID=246786 RepID=UPI002493C445|nr:hypothetical protein [Metabacillus indicus]